MVSVAPGTSGAEEVAGRGSRRNFDRVVEELPEEMAVCAPAGQVSRRHTAIGVTVAPVAGEAVLTRHDYLPILDGDARCGVQVAEGRM
jgi:hypothetical protein